MQRPRSWPWIKMVATACLLLFSAGLLWLDLSPRKQARILDVPTVSQDLPAAKPTVPRDLVEPQTTGEPTSIPPPPPPTWTPEPPTPSPVTLQPAVLITPVLVSTIVQAGPAGLTEKSTIDSTESIQDLTWAPTGDKLVYLTASGKLYWSNLDGSNSTLLHEYSSTFSGPLDQQPMADTLFVPGYAIHFTAGQPPVFTAAPATYLRQMRWWSSDRASGIASTSYAPGGYVGGDMLVTVDANGQFVEERNIPYIWTGAVQPGGEWLAYTTNQQATGVPFYGSDPETAYLLNLHTGQRLQLSSPGRGRGVHSWSPDRNWILLSACNNEACGVVLASADGQEWINLTFDVGGDAVWSPDSKHIAFSIQRGGCDEPNQPNCAPHTSKVSIIDVPAGKLADVATTGPGTSSSGMMMRPSWSPDGGLLTLLSYDPNCGPPCSELTPAFYMMTLQ